ncbi:hypothetical protein CNYM01_10792 [Colletotrichum nymphaeae SA-01]|uniref:CFEM domain-containing protein n=1 Tax=Colletotrichum nymphaeae SA-01 TaxID=1460502 RepID=A0A135SKC7_9PEZI|nr:hypothetical protein CNYM01_10792 [Colletotrichum nymphaeae SA-01]
MKYSYILLATAGLAAAQQKFTDVVPKCSIECLTKAVKDGTKCSSIDDSACICEADNYRSIYTVGVNCVLQACGSDVAIGTSTSLNSFSLFHIYEASRLQSSRQ